MTRESERLNDAREGRARWMQWGPYLSERQWGTVREDYSDSGDAWNYFTHDQSRSRAYRWGEDGIAGISDDKQVLCFALALWNGKDPILKERLFGLPNSEGNHGEDVKEYYYYLDSTPTHSYMKYLYKYPQAAFPYADLVDTNRRRNRFEQEYELIDTGAFEDDRYFDVFVEYAKDGPDDILIKITVCNRGSEAADLSLLPTLWYRNTWSWGGNPPKPALSGQPATNGIAVIEARDERLGERRLFCDGAPELLFTENETNTQRLFDTPNAQPFVKDAFDRYVVHGEASAINPARTGTKAAALYRLPIPAGAAAEVRLRLSPSAPSASRQGKGKGKAAGPFGDAFEQLLAERKADADAFYASITPAGVSADAAQVMRQALAGMLWSKQYFGYDVLTWLKEHGIDPYRERARTIRNREWSHMFNDDVISMPDKWEYPWYAAWDLAFHAVPLAMVDPEFAKKQLVLMLSERYQHPNGQIPAYEWNFGDVNPPVHPWATLFVYSMEQGQHGRVDLEFLKFSFQKLLMNFTWWVNRKDIEGNNLFGGGFLGLDNIGVFDRSSPLPTGGYLEQSDGTAWMAFFCASMLGIATELAAHDPVYEDLALKFFEHFMRIAGAMDRVGIHNDELWDEEDGFFYDLLYMPGGHVTRLKVRSMVGLLPLCSAVLMPGDAVERLPALSRRALDFIERNPDIMKNIADPRVPGVAGRRLMAVVGEDKLRRILARMLDENEFLSDYGIRSLSRCHLDDPYVFSAGREAFKVQYEAAESTSGMFGGNSNWRGPIWMPVNVLLIRALLTYYLYYGNDFKVECPTGSGQMMTLFEVAREISRRLVSIFERNAAGRRPAFGDSAKFQDDPHWRDYHLFYEYFHGDNGAGIGASHQTGWTGLVAKLIQLFGSLDADSYLQSCSTLMPMVAQVPETVTA